MKISGSRLAFFVAALVFASTAHAQSRIDDCEKIQAADAYNQCLAKFGPPAKTGNLEPERPGDIKSSSAEAAAGAQKVSRGKGRSAGRRLGRGKVVVHRSRSHRVGRASRGRKRMTISVGR